MSLAKIIIDTKHTADLVQGKWIAIKVPPGADVLQICLSAIRPPRNYMAEIIDTFFNGRSAK